MRIVNLNTWVGCLPRGVLDVVSLEPPGHKKKRFEILLAELRERDPDFVTFQECLPLPQFAVEMAKALDYDVVYRVANAGLRMFGVGFPPGIGLGEGMAILAKKSHRMVSLGAKKLSGAGFVSNWGSVQFGPCRYALAARALVDGHPVIVVTTHIRYGFPSREAFQAAWIEMHKRGITKDPTPPRWIHDLTHSNGEARDKEIRRLARWLLELRTKNQGAPVLVGADFNIDPDTPQMSEFLAATGYRNVLPERHPGALTWDPRGNANIAYGIDMKWPDGSDKSTILQMMAYLDSIPQTPDHVLISPGLELSDCGLACAAPRDGAFASDHYGIWADAARVQT